MNLDHFVVHTDGASRKDGRGGWGYTIATDWGERYDMCGGEHDTTNNRMELMGAIQALMSIDSCAEGDEALKVELWTDSQYVLKGITEYIDDWKFRRWRTAANEPVKNRDLWERLDVLAARHDIDWRWVKGHTGNDGNERADRLAAQGIPAEDKSKRQGATDTRAARVPIPRRTVGRSSPHGSCQDSWGER